MNIAMKKYILTDEVVNRCGKVLHRIKAIRNFGDVKSGDLGGWIEKEDNLSHYGNCWVYDEAHVFEDARVSGNSRMLNHSEAFDKAQIRENSQISGAVFICGEARICGNSQVSGNVWLGGRILICGDAEIRRNADILQVSRIGSRYDTTTIYRTQTGIQVVCGCFLGTLKEFANKVEETHGDNKYGKEYAAVLELAKVHFGLGDTDTD